MDKYEYKSKTERMLELMESGAYSRAAAIADEIDWRRVRNAVMLSNVSEIYEKTGEYQKGYDILTLAYQRAEGSRKIISRLCGLALKTGNVDEAIDFYDEFMQIAPKDPNQYILRYKILRAQRAPIEQQIEALEEYKKSEYIEEWAYELAKLYQEAGMTSECLEECDDLILWFSEGQYVYKAMELKMQYKPLTPSQQEKYDKRYARTSEETEEIPDIFSYAEADESEQEEEENGLPGAELMAADSEVADADFAAEQQLPLAGLGVVERFDAEHIAGAVQGIRLGIADNKGEHAAQLGGQGSAVFLVAVEQHLGVGVGLEDMALLEQLLPQLPVVVDFAVEGENLGAVFVENGLAAAGEVDYGQPPETHGDALVNVVIGLVGAAVGDGIHHAL